MLDFLNKHPKKTSFLLGSLSVLALPPFYFFPILFISFSLFIHLLNNSTSIKKSFYIGYFMGSGFFAFGFSWIGNALLIDPLTFGWLYPLVLIASGGFFGLFWAFPAILSFPFKTKIAKILAFSSFYVLFEWLRSFLLTGFPWNLLGSVFAFSPKMLQLASLTGTYGLSLLVLICCSFLSIGINKKNLKFFSIPIILILFTYTFGHLRLKALNDDSVSNTTIRIVQPSIPQSMKWSKETAENNFQEHIRLSQKEGLDNIDFVIWGETASPYILDLEPEKLKEITKAIPQNGYLITGSVRLETNEEGSLQPLNSMFVINKEGSIINHYDKSHLVPFGEYIPLRRYLPSWITPITNTIANFKQGTPHKIISIPEHPDFSALICYEIIFPSQIINKDNKPQWLINLTNDGWYGDSAGPRQHLVTTQLRAIEEGITISRVANSGISAIISRTGCILDEIPLNTKGILDIKLPSKLSTKTLYGELGNLIPVLLCFVGLLIALTITVRHNKLINNKL